MELCKRCLQPREASIHGPVETCVEPSGGPCKEQKAHHEFQEEEPVTWDPGFIHALVN